MFKPGCAIAPFTHIFMFWRITNKFLRHPGAENLLQYWLQMRCDRVLLKYKQSFKIIEKIHLNRQSGMIFACSLCIFCYYF